MAITFDKALGIHQQAIQVRADRAEILANNIANADTPNFQSRDMDFKAILNGQSNQLMQATTTNTKHVSTVISPDFAADLMYRVPTQPSVDGNTVDVQEEMAAFGENALAYQASFEFLNGKFKGLKLAVKGSA
ncbi:MAG: flagellar basal body rod protein FlgB [Pseudomonadales bacterium]|nr:flagellar basal body rod protein FlgB [Pseudomonadales bacterium]NRA17354.1 flagellar basal body rod protein FlgB [Oceanospirillaceae bacterium]